MSVSEGKKAASYRWNSRCPASLPHTGNGLERHIGHEHTPWCSELLTRDRICNRPGKTCQMCSFQLTQMRFHMNNYVKKTFIHARHSDLRTVNVQAGSLLKKIFFQQVWSGLHLYYYHIVVGKLLALYFACCLLVTAFIEPAHCICLISVLLMCLSVLVTFLMISFNCKLDVAVKVVLCHICSCYLCFCCFFVNLLWNCSVESKTNSPK